MVMRKHYWLYLFKVIVFFLLVYILIDKMQFFQSLQNKQLVFPDLLKWMLFLVATLMPLNWWLEIKKWQLLLSAEKISFKDAAKSVLGGLTIGMATPARVGEFVGRIAFLNENIRVPALLKSALGGLIQSFFTLFVPIVFSFFLINNFLPGYYNSFLFLGVILLAAAVAFFFFLPKIATLSFFKKYNIETALSSFSVVELFKITTYSGFRYVVYTAQYVLLFYALNTQQNWTIIIANCSAMLLLQSISPLAAWLDLPIRSGVAVLLFSPFIPQKEIIVFIPFFVWIINLLLPSIVGYYFVFKLKNNATKS